MLSAPEKPDTRAQSEVTGTVLLLALAIVIAAAVGFFAFDLLDRRGGTTPSATFSYDYDRSAGTLTVTHEGGSEFRRADVTFVRVSGSGAPSVRDPWPNEVTSGESTTLENVAPDDVINIRWEEPREGGTSSILDTWRGPKAPS